MLSAVIPSKLSYSTMLLAEQPIHQRFVLSGPLVLGKTPLKQRRLWQIEDQPVSRRFEPSSRTALIGEQPNPWDLLQPQEKMSRHRGAEPHRRYGLLDATSLLCPGELLSDGCLRYYEPQTVH